MGWWCDLVCVYVFFQRYSIYILLLLLLLLVVSIEYISFRIAHLFAIVRAFV